MGSDEEGYAAKVSGLLSGDFVGVYTAYDYSFDFLVCLSSGVQIQARRRFSFCSLACLRYVSLVLFHRCLVVSDEFYCSEFLFGEKSGLSGEFAACYTDYVSALGQCFFCGVALFDVCGLWIYAEYLQFAGLLLLVCNDLPRFWTFSGYLNLSDFPQRYRAAGWHADSVWFLGNADFLEFGTYSGGVAVDV